MSTSYNNIVRSVAARSLFDSAKKVLTSSVTFNQGDLIAFDTSNHILKAVSATGDAANILGVAVEKISSGVVSSPYTGTAVDSSVAIEDIKGPVYGVVATMTMKTGDTFHPGDKAYVVASDAQTVTATNPGDGNYIGIYQGALVSSASAGQTGEFLIGCRYGAGGALLF